MAVVLDIGGEVGAAVIYAPASLAGREIEIRAAAAEWDGRHVAVHRREMPDRSVYAAVFPALTQGPWEVRVRDDHEAVPVRFEVTGGRVTSTSLTDRAGIADRAGNA